MADNWRLDRKDTRQGRTFHLALCHSTSPPLPSYQAAAFLRAVAYFPKTKVCIQMYSGETSQRLSLLFSSPSDPFCRVPISVIS